MNKTTLKKIWGYILLVLSVGLAAYGGDSFNKTKKAKKAAKKK